MADKKEFADNQGLGLIVFSGDFSRVHYALVMAGAAAATNKHVTVFFTMEGSRALVDNDADGNPGWQGLEGPKGMTPKQVDKEYGEKGIARFDELLEACGELGVSFMVCEMGLRALDLEQTPLRQNVKILKGGVVSFLAAAKDCQILFI